MTKQDALNMLGDATFYLAERYPFIKNDLYRETPERIACEIIIALKDLVELLT
jgi:hypothetical protein